MIPGLFVFGRLPSWARWAALVVATVSLSLGLESLGLPAAFLLGPMVAAAALAIRGGSVRLPDWPFYAAQGVIGCLIARSFNREIFGMISRHWLLFPSVVLSAIAASTALGWLLARLRVLPGSTAVWGTSPGAASAMSLFAEAYGADPQLVAFMQYLRVLLVAASASLVAGFAGGGSQAGRVVTDWLPAVDGAALAQTLALACGGAFLGRLLRIPAGPLLVPLFSVAALRLGTSCSLELPPFLLVPSYCLVGWHIGLGFTPSILRSAARALPKVLLSILALLVICAGFGLLLSRFAGVRPLTAYLATSPGGADSIAIIAASSQVDMPFVMALQTVRLVIVMALSPRIARALAGMTAGQRAAHEPPPR